jgi:hypothetical protein
MRAFYRASVEKFQKGKTYTSIDWVIRDPKTKDKFKPWKIFAWSDGLATDRELAVYNYGELSQLPDLEEATIINLRQLIRFTFKAKYEL